MLMEEVERGPYFGDFFAAHLVVDLRGCASMSDIDHGMIQVSFERIQKTKITIFLDIA